MYCKTTPNTLQSRNKKSGQGSADVYRLAVRCAAVLIFVRGSLRRLMWHQPPRFWTALAAFCDRYASRHQHIRPQQPRLPARRFIRSDGYFLFVARGITDPRWNKGTNIMFCVGAASLCCLLQRLCSSKGDFPPLFLLCCSRVDLDQSDISPTDVMALCRHWICKTFQSLWMTTLAISLPICFTYAVLTSHLLQIKPNCML